MSNTLTVSYKGTDIINEDISSEVTKTLLTSGKYCEGDILISAEGGGSASTLITKTVTANGTYNASDDNADGYSEVTVAVSGGGGITLDRYQVYIDGTSYSNAGKAYLGYNDDTVYSGYNHLVTSSQGVINNSNFKVPFKTNIIAMREADGLIAPYNVAVSSNPLNSFIKLGYANPTAGSVWGGRTMYLLITNDCKLTFIGSCFLPETEITLTDGSRKKIEDITYEDKLKVWNFDKGEFDEAPICWITKRLYNDHIYRITFSNGTIVNFTGHKSNHKIYNVDTRRFENVSELNIGDRIFSEDGIVSVTNKEYIKQEVEYYNLITTGTINCFANGILASDRYGNMYPIDEDMKYIKGDRPIRPYSEFEPHHIKRYWYDNLRLGELTDDIDDVVNYIGKLECQMLPLNDI